MGDYVRILFVSAALLATASCAMPPPQQQGANCPAARRELAREAAAQGANLPPSAPAVPPPVAATVATPPPPPAAYRPVGFFGLPLFQPPVRNGRLLLSNYTFARAEVEALVTPYRDCTLHPGLTPRTAELPLNATWIVASPPGSNICWRRIAPAPSQAAAAARPDWNRAVTATGRSVDARL
jgi:hypothetical protein